MTGPGEGETAADRPAGRGWGGKRPGAGRPPGRQGGPVGDDPIHAQGLLGYALRDARDLLTATMRNESTPIEIRTCCALGLALLVGGKGLGGRRKPDLAEAGAGGNEQGENVHHGD